MFLHLDWSPPVLNSTFTHLPAYGLIADIAYQVMSSETGLCRSTDLEKATKKCYRTEGSQENLGLYKKFGTTWTFPRAACQTDQLGEMGLCGELTKNRTVTLAELQRCCVEMEDTSSRTTITAALH